MKITYAVMPTGEPVRFIEDGALAARRAVKTTLKNLKRWCAKLRRGKTARDVGFKSNRPNSPGKIETCCCSHAVTTKIMIVEEEESRNRANENLENELRESLASNDPRRTISSAMIADVNLAINSLREDDESPVEKREPAQEFFRELEGSSHSF